MLAPRIYLCSATGALTTDAAPVGGGVAVLEALIPRLAETEFEVTLLTPGHHDQRDGIRQTLAVPTLSDGDPERILRLDARRYANFALEWEAALDRYFAEIDPNGAVVLANDTSEGPPFARLHERGFRQIALLHVIVADFFTRRYFSQPTGIPIQARHLAALWRAAERSGMGRYAPDIARLVWTKEAELAQFVDAPIVPSAPLARTIVDCYPQTGVERRVQVVPWGVVGAAQPSRRQQRRATLRELNADVNRFTLLTLSRISPEKRIELVLDALELIEQESPVTAQQIQLIVAGAPAYMGGHAYNRQLQRHARRLRAIPVHFAGYVADEAKWNLFAAADTFLSPSWYEAYGLTIAQALGSGTPVIAAPHAGARATIEPDCGWIAEASPRAFAAAIRRAFHAHETHQLDQFRNAAAAWGTRQPFTDAAERIIAIARTLSTRTTGATP